MSKPPLIPKTVPPVIPGLPPKQSLPQSLPQGMGHCRTCRQMIAILAHHCPHCGAPDPSGHYAQQESRRQSRTLLKNIVVVCLVGGLTVWTVNGCLKMSEEARQREAARQAAMTPEQRVAEQQAKQDQTIATQSIFWAQRAVKQKLKSPATAKFPGEILHRDEYQVQKLPDDVWRVRSWVDAQNSFGALIRSRWTAELKLSGDPFTGNWQTVKVEIE